MATIPPVTEKSSVVQAIYGHYENVGKSEPARGYLGSSIVGKSCERELWYDFRWTTTPEISGRIYRLFQSGHREEARIIADLETIGATVWPINPETGKQWAWSENDLGNHYAGSADGIIQGLPEAPKSPHLLECKTHSIKSFKDLVAKRVKASKPQHYAQMQQYMHWTIKEFGKTNGCQRALYIAVCKDTDEMYAERIEYDADYCALLLAKATRVIFSSTPLEKLSDDASWYECKFCNHSAVCHGTAAPLISCRTCAHSSPEKTGNARWTCALHEGNDIPMDVQRTGCASHRYLPAMLSNFAEPIDADAEENWIKYRLKANGKEFLNGDPTVGLTSQEIHDAEDKHALGDASVQEIRELFDARIGG